MNPEPAAPRGTWRGRLPAALAHRSYTLLWVALLADGFGAQMAAVAVGWQVFELRHSPLDLGLIGLAEFVPLPLLALPAGHLSDRFSRRLLFAGATAATVLTTSLLLVVSLTGAHSLWPYLLLAAATGAAQAIAIPPGRALPAMIVPFDLIASAMALRSVAFQVATIAGPAVGGLLFTIGPEVVYGVAAAMLTIGLGCVLAMREPDWTRSDEAPSLESVLAGIRF